MALYKHECPSVGDGDDCHQILVTVACGTVRGVSQPAPPSPPSLNCQHPTLTLNMQVQIQLVEGAGGGNMQGIYQRGGNRRKGEEKIELMVEKKKNVYEWGKM